MSYEIINNYTNLQLVLSTTQSNYSSIRLNTYINDSTEIFKTYTPLSTQTSEGYDLTFNILTKDYTIGDIITKFELSLASNTHLWQTSEGIVWLLDGKEYSTTHTNSETFNFQEQGSHTIEAVYTGNDSIELASTGKHPLLIKQPEIDESGSLQNNGAYTIEFVDKNLKSMVYDDNSKLEFILLKGGVPVTTGNRNIEIFTPNEVISSVPLSNKGTGYVRNKRWKVGKYELGAYYQDENNHTLTRTKRTVTITKGTPKFYDNFNSNGNFIPNSQYKVLLKFNGDPLAKTKIVMYVNGKSKTLTTDKYGAVYHKFDKTGTFKIKTVYKGNNNLKKIELDRTITVVKANG